MNGSSNSGSLSLVHELSNIAVGAYLGKRTLQERDSLMAAAIDRAQTAAYAEGRNDQADASAEPTQAKTREPEVPEKVQDALADLLENQFELGVFAGKFGRRAVTPAQCTRAADSLKRVIKAIRVTLSEPNADAAVQNVAEARRPDDPEAERPISATQPASPARGVDSQRLDWLETMTINVRKPMRYGSHSLFWATPTDEDGEPAGPSDLRAQIDRALREQGR